MTKEQAIEVLHELDRSLYETQQVALDMAIEALEQQPSDDEITITMKKGTLKYSGQGYVAYKKDWFRKHFATEVEIMTYFDGYRKEQEKTKSSVPLSEIYRVIAGHSDYHGDNILAALTCIAEGKEVDTVKPLSQPTSDYCVSRKAVDLLCFKYLKPNNDDNVAFYEHFCDLPPVTPTRKVGKWIMPDKYYDKNIWRKCSVCNTHFEKYHKYVAFSGEVTYTEEIANFCKVCGAEMVGAENG